MVRNLKRTTLLLLLVFACIGMQGQTIYDWGGGAPDGNWRQGAPGARWFPGGLWDEPPTNNILRFNNNNQPVMSNIVGGTYNIFGLIFGSSNNSSARTIGGNTIRFFDFGGNAPYIQNDSPLIHTLTLPIEGDGDATDPLLIRINNVGLNFSGNINNQGSTINVIGTTTNASTVNFSGIISGSGGLYKENANIIVELNATNTYSGQTTAQAGIIRLLNIDGLGNNSGNTVVLAGGTIELAAAANYDSGENFVLNGDGASGEGALRKTDTGIRNFTGDILSNSDTEIEVTGGTLDFRGELDFAGNTVTFDGSQHFTFGSGSSFDGANKTVGFGAINKTGSGNLTIRPAIGLTGNIRVNGGELRQATGSYPSSGQITLENGVTYRSDDNPSRDIAKPVQITGNITIGHSTGAVGEIDFLSTVDLFALTRTLTMTNDNFISGQMLNGSFNKAGTGSLTIQGSTANTLSDGSSVSAGTLILAKDAGLQATSGLSIQAGATVQTNNDNQWGTTAPPFIQIFGGTLDINNTNQRLALAGDASASITLGSGTVTIDGTGTDTFSGIISGTGGLSKEGTGTEILAGTNNYSGTTTITEGTLELGASDVLPNTSAIVLNGGALRSTGTITETMGTLELAENSTIDLNGTGEILTFANSTGVTWNTDATLTIMGWTGTAEEAGTTSKIFIGNVANTLTNDQMLRVQFVGAYDFGAILLPSGELVPKKQNIQRFEDFNRMANHTLGGTSSGLGSAWNETEDLSSCTPSGGFIRINSSGQLLLSNDDEICPSFDGGERFAAIDVSTLYATRFEDADSLLEWYFNMQQSEHNPSRLNRTAFILGSTGMDFRENSGTQGYAVVIGESSVPDDLHLIYFNDGLPNTNTFAGSIITQSVASEQSHFSVKVTFDPCSSEWTFTIREDGLNFNDPASITGIGGTAINTTHVNKDLIYIGAYRDFTASTIRTSLFDNIYIPDSPPAANFYVWNQAGDGDYQIASNWTPTRTCSRGGDVLRFNSGGTHIISNVPSEFIGQLVVESSTTVTLRDAIIGGPAPSRLTISGRSSGTDLIVENGSSLIYDTGNTLADNYLEIALASGATGEISGNLDFTKSFSGTTPQHKLLAEDFESIRITSTGQVRAFVLSAAADEHPFGRLLPNETVIFESGSVYESHSGGHPFGSNAPGSKVRFETGSTYRHIGNHLFSYGNRQYANFEYQNNSTPQTLNSGTTAGWSMEDFRIQQGTLTLDGDFNDLPFIINVTGDFEIAGGATLNYTPVVAVPPAQSIFNFNGTTQQIITGNGNLIFNERVTIEVNNSYNAGGYALEIQSDLELFADLIITDGELQGADAIITMSGNNTTLFVEDNGSIYGAGVGQNLSLVSNDPFLTLAGGNSSVCRFFNLTINDNLEFNVDRPLLEVQFGTFTVGNNSILRINTSGEAILGASVGPTYGVNSELIYNSGATTERGAEWSTTSGAGYPVNVTIQNGSTVEVTNSVLTDYGIQGDLNIGDAVNGTGTLTMIDVAHYLQVDGDINIGTGVIPGVLSLSSAVSGGDVRVRGNWNNNENGTFNSNGRAVYFNGSSGDQFINKLGASTIEVFDYLIVEKTSGNLVIGTNTTEVDARGQFGGNALQLFDGSFDLAGKTFNLGKSGNADGMSVSNGLREVFSLIPGAIFNIEGNNNKVISSSSGGTLEFDDQTTVRIAAGVNFGSSVTTINASLEILVGGFANVDAPIYGPDGVLIYNTGGNYDRRVEWDGSTGNPGYPNDVIIRSGTSVLAATSSGFNNRPMNLDRNLTIESGGSLFLDGGSVNMNLPLVIGGDLSLGGGLSGSSTGGDIQLKGDWDFLASGSFFPNDCEVLFNGTSGQQTLTATSGVTLADMEIDNPDGLVFDQNLRISGDFNFNDGIVEPTSSEQLIFEDDATASNASNLSYFEGVVVKEGDDEFVFPIGDTNINDTPFYQPLKIFNLGDFGTFQAQYFAEENQFAGEYYDGDSNSPFDFQEIGNCDYWNFQRLSGAVNPFFGVRYNNPDITYCNDVTDQASLRMSSYNTLDWDPVNSAVLADFVESGVRISTPDGGGYGDIALSSGNQANVLPITLLFFQAKAVDNLVRTDWVTASEINNDFFTIERSKDGNYWEEAGRIKGAGNSNIELSYDFVDEAPYSGISYYRLRQTDFDGTTTLSEPQAVEILQGNDFGLDKVYRGQDGLNLVYRATAPYVVAEIYDLLGKRIHGELIENYGNGFSTIHPDLARGVYILRLSHGSEMDSEKFVW